ncbi:MAG: N-acetylmuramoyl-L-alanine amidase [Myxococcaceae bacterium]|nr:N-acetylmuramoyl-L-alanine amidase [Myxococcaceae bacterium]
MKIIDHRLHQDDGTPYPFVETPNHGEKLSPEFLVMHYTAMHEAKKAVDWLVNPAAQASAHLVIGRDGSITQLVPFDTIAWHAGRSSWDGRTGLNRYSIGIELDNAGRLTRQGAKWCSWIGREVAEDQVVQAVHKNDRELAGWEAFSEPLLQVALEVSLLLFQTYKLKDVIGHDDIAPQRKQDPGPAFPMHSFRARMLGRAEEHPVVHEVTTTLNIRSGPGTSNPTVPGSPLPPGTKVEILSKQGEWRRVDVLQPVNGQADLQGWVHQRYLKRID